MELLAVSRGVALAYGIGLWVVLVIGPATVTAVKGLFDAGFYAVGFVWWIAAFRFGTTPESWWARHLYGPKKACARRSSVPGKLGRGRRIELIEV